MTRSLLACLPCCRRKDAQPDDPEAKLPALTFLVLCTINLSEAIMGNTLFSYLPSAMIHWGFSEHDVGRGVGVLGGSFFLSSFISVFLWGRLADKIGRRTCLLLGTLGTALSMTVFAFAQTYEVALFARLLTGATSANVAVSKTFCGEVSNTKTIHKAFALLNFCWGLGAIIAPSIGGFLADPARSYPSVAFFQAPFFLSFPYALPSLVCVAFSCFAFTVGFFKLPETEAFLAMKEMRALAAMQQQQQQGVQGGVAQHAQEEAGSRGTSRNRAGSIQGAGAGEGGAALKQHMSPAPTEISSSNSSKPMAFRRQRAGSSSSGTGYAAVATSADELGEEQEGREWQASASARANKRKQSAAVAPSNAPSSSVAIKLSIEDEEEEQRSEARARLADSLRDETVDTSSFVVDAGAPFPQVVVEEGEEGDSSSSEEEEEEEEEEQGGGRGATAGAGAAAAAAAAGAPAKSQHHHSHSHSHSPVQPPTGPIPPRGTILDILRDPIVMRCIFGCYGMLALAQIVFDELLSVFMQTPVNMLGLGLSTTESGSIQVVAGLTQICGQLLVVPLVVKKFGALRCFRHAMWPLTLLCLFPIVARVVGTPALMWLLLGLFVAYKTMLTTIGFTGVFVLINNSERGGGGLSLVNSVAQGTASLMRTVGPALGGSLFSASLDFEALGSWRLHTVYMAVACVFGLASLATRKVPAWVDIAPALPNLQRAGAGAKGQGGSSSSASSSGGGATVVVVKGSTGSSNSNSSSGGAPGELELPPRQQQHQQQVRALKVGLQSSPSLKPLSSTALQRSGSGAAGAAAAAAAVEWTSSEDEEESKGAGRKRGAATRAASKPATPQPASFSDSKEEEEEDAELERQLQDLIRETRTAASAATASSGAVRSSLGQRGPAGSVRLTRVAGR